MTLSEPHMGIEMHQAHMLVLSPVSSVWVEKKKISLVHTHAQFPQDFWEFP